MARKSEFDDRQNDFFGVPSPHSAEHKPPIRKTQAPPAAPVVEPIDRQAGPLPSEIIQQESVDIQLCRMSSAEFRALATIVSEDVLAGLTLAFMRELQRRIAKNHRHERIGRKSGLERAAEQLIAEMGGQNDDYDD